MATKEDLESAIAAIGQILGRLSTDIGTLVDRFKTNPAIPDADVQALAAIATDMGSQADKIEAVLNPPATPS